MFAKPRPKKSPFPPAPSKKRKAAHAIEEITFDNGARAEYLTGFHKRKVQRQKHAQEEAAKKARQERIDLRKQVRIEAGGKAISFSVKIFFTELFRTSSALEGKEKILTVAQTVTDP